MYKKQRKVLLSLMLVGGWILVYLYLSHVVSLQSGPSIQYSRGTEGQGFTLQPSINRANGSSRTTTMILEQTGLLETLLGSTSELSYAI